VLARPLGVVDLVFKPTSPVEAARRACELGFDHIDLTTDFQGELALPVRDRISRRPAPDRTVGAPPDEPGMWERAVRAYRRHPGMRVEPWPGSIVDSIEKVKALLAEVPGLRLTLDTGHVACWGEDPVELLPWADVVQLRQARRGVAQALDGDVDFARLFAHLDERGYRGPLSIEYFDLPERGWRNDDPVGMTVALAARLRPLLGR
jgi:sugar phosphate isomerase/epimerase